MYSPDLEQLRNEDFLMRFGIIATPGALHNALGQDDRVKELRTSLSRGAVSEESISQFVAGLLDDLRRDQLFPYDVSLAALAVVLETWHSDFAEEFILGLARLKRSEMPMAIGVARRSARRLKLGASNYSSGFGIVVGDPKLFRLKLGAGNCGRGFGIVAGDAKLFCLQGDFFIIMKPSAATDAEIADDWKIVKCPH